MTDIKDLPGLKARDIGTTLRGQPVSAQGPIFYRVTIEQYILDTNAIRRQHGLEMMVGNAAIAAAMGPNEDLAKQMQSNTVFLGGEDILNTRVAELLAEGDE